MQIGQQVNTHRYLLSLRDKLRLVKKIIAGNPAKLLIIRRLLVIEQRVDSPLLAKIGQRLEEAGLAQRHTVTIAVVL
jgi:hypothetical protein